MCSSSTEAINACYKEVFCSNAKFPGPLVMGFDNPDIVEQLFSDVIFRPFMFSLARLSIFVLGMGKSEKQEYNYAGDGYKSVLQCKFNNVRSVYVQNLGHEECTVEVFIDGTLELYNASNPNKVWLDIGRFPNYTGKTLFGLECSYTQFCIEQVQIPSCTVLQWTSEGVLESLYEYHLKRRTLCEIKWRDFFDKWLNQESSIIELQGAVLDLYSHGHEISDRE